MIEPRPISPQDTAARIAYVCALLEADPDSYMIAEVGEVEGLDPATSAHDTDAALQAIGGMRCGDINIAAEPYPDTEIIYDLLDGGPERWAVVGEIDAVPFAADRQDGSIWHSARASGESYDTQPQRIAPDVWTFIAWYVLGPGYLDISPVGTTADKNLWLRFLQNNGLLEPGTADSRQHLSTAITYDELRTAWGAQGLLRFPAERFPEAPGLHPHLLPPAALYPQQVPVLLKTTGLPEQTPLNAVIEWATSDGTVDLAVIGAPEHGDSLLYCLAPDTGAVYLLTMAKPAVEIVNSSLGKFVDCLYQFSVAMARAASLDPESPPPGPELRTTLTAIDPIAMEPPQSWWNMIIDQVSTQPIAGDGGPTLISEQE